MHHRGNHENRHSKTPINKGLKNPKHDKRASQVRDGWLTVLNSQVPFLLGFKIGQMHFFVKVEFEGRHE
jgi:hypothetical protein